MPQNLFPLTIAGDDTTYIVYSTDELWQVPDSVLSLQTKQYYYELSQKLNEPQAEPRVEDNGFFGFGMLIFILFLVIMGVKARHEELEEDEEIKKQREYDYAYLPAYHTYKVAEKNFYIVSNKPFKEMPGLL